MTFAPGTSAAAQAASLAAAGATATDSIAVLRMQVVDIARGSDTIAALRADGNVTRVEADRVRSAEAAPDDPRYDDQWSLRTIGWDQLYGSVQPQGSAVVAVLDTGVDGSTPDLAGQLVPGTSVLDGSDGRTDPNGHGTAMAGIIAAASGNGTAIAGIGYQGVRVMPVTVLGPDGLGQDSDIIAGIVWAVGHGADVINMSFSNPGFSTGLQAAVDYAWAHDVVVVAAAGNDASHTATFPAGDRAVVGVSNTDRDDRLDPSSNDGDSVFLAAPGQRHRDAPAGRRHDQRVGHLGLLGRGGRRGRPAAGHRPGRQQRGHRVPPGAHRRRGRHGRPDRQRPARPGPRRGRHRDRLRAARGRHPDRLGRAVRGAVPGSRRRHCDDHRAVTEPCGAGQFRDLQRPGPERVHVPLRGFKASAITGVAGVSLTSSTCVSLTGSATGNFSITVGTTAATPTGRSR